MQRALKMRLGALPVIKSKEAALRGEVKKARGEAVKYERELAALLDEHDYMVMLWGEFDQNLVRVVREETGEQKIAGVEIPVLRGVVFEHGEWEAMNAPLWWKDGVELVERLIMLRKAMEFLERKTSLLEYARKKTTQKVNLYEKVQIPEYQDAILRIKRFMEDEENLSKSAQKIVKARRKEESAA